MKDYSHFVSGFLQLPSRESPTGVRYSRANESSFKRLRLREG